jgi:vacuolar-type H+-ATPase subunit F/Vma7
VTQHTVVAPHVLVALGEAALVEGYRLAGAHVCAAETDDDVRQLWGTLPPTTGVVILTPHAADALRAALTDPAALLTAVMPS